MVTSMADLCAGILGDMILVTTVSGSRRASGHGIWPFGLKTAPIVRASLRRPSRGRLVERRFLSGEVGQAVQ
jgi:hypothetical protein